MKKFDNHYIHLQTASATSKGKWSVKVDDINIPHPSSSLSVIQPSDFEIAIPTTSTASTASMPGSCVSDPSVASSIEPPCPPTYPLESYRNLPLIEKLSLDRYFESEQAELKQAQLPMHRFPLQGPKLKIGH